MFGRVAIINRGEAAMRLINAVRELTAELKGRLQTLFDEAEGRSA